ncbi:MULTISPECIES: ectoine/hydroxyectoine ABC transporter permease subunit EhuC [Paenibacillus]|uniref:Ectoine/hydroxyectoine ABC transporter permease subunit EhuC n=1 Tax=Paenibacillus residui TaxID=629724 RepID=A0ABW3D9Z7_9BACL|nr:ectoine/hydroxyectoine ABC transporter permease subunit EhuC [Aneurinibacillus sp. XH2]
MDSWADFLPTLMRGVKITLLVTIYSTIFAFVMSFIAGFGRLSKFRIIRWVTVIYVEIFRGTSLLVQLFWIYFALPMLIDVRVSALMASVLALGLNSGAYGSEVVRSSILAVPRGQTEATIALNMTPGQRMRLVILPQAFVRMLPAFGNLLIELLKGTSLVSFITVMDLTYQGMILRSYSNYHTTEIFIMLLVIYFIIAYVLTLIVRWFEKRAAAGRS